MSLNRDDILKATDIVIEKIPVPEWGGEVFVKSMSGTERDAFETSVIQQRVGGARVNTNDMRAKLAALTLCDENGKRLFTDKDVAELGKKSALALNRVFMAAQRLSGLGQEALDELTGGLKENPFDDSPSA